MVNCKQMDEIHHLFGLLCYILCCKKQTNVYFNKLNESEEFEDEEDFHVNGATYLEKFPFVRHFTVVF